MKKDKMTCKLNLSRSLMKDLLDNNGALEVSKLVCGMISEEIREELEKKGKIISARHKNVGSITVEVVTEDKPQ